MILPPRVKRGMVERLDPSFGNSRTRSRRPDVGDGNLIRTDSLYDRRRQNGQRSRDLLRRCYTELTVALFLTRGLPATIGIPELEGYVPIGLPGLDRTRWPPSSC